jgi:general secretion pathway protein K
VITKEQQVFVRLFDALGIDKRVLAAIIDWVDQDSEPRSVPAPGAEQAFYLGLTPPVIVRNTPIYTMRELLQVRGVTPKLLAQLEQFVYVAPPGTSDDDGKLRVNVNTASATVIAALSDGLASQPGIVKRLIATRNEQPFTYSDPSTIDQEVTGWQQALGDGSEFVTTYSSYFRVDAHGEVNDVARAVTAILWREPQKARNPRMARVVWMPSTADASLTSQPASDFLDSLPPVRRSD